MCDTGQLAAALGHYAQAVNGLIERIDVRPPFDAADISALYEIGSAAADLTIAARRYGLNLAVPEYRATGTGWPR